MCRHLAPLAAVLAVLLAAPAARADVLVSAPPKKIGCYDDIEMAVWYQSYSGGARWAKLRILTPDGYPLYRKNVRATTRWRSWWYTPPDCAATYKVRYTTAQGTPSP
jgi:hypothetical protein